MAKKRREEEGPKKPEGPDRSGWAKQPVLFQLRGDPAFKEFMQGLAEAEGHKTLADLVERALRVYTRSVGYGKPIPKR